MRHALVKVRKLVSLPDNVLTVTFRRYSSLFNASSCKYIQLHYLRTCLLIVHKIITFNNCKSESYMIISDTTSFLVSKLMAIEPRLVKPAPETNSCSKYMSDIES